MTRRYLIGIGGSVLLAGIVAWRIGSRNPERRSEDIRPSRPEPTGEASVAPTPMRPAQPTVRAEQRTAWRGGYRAAAAEGGTHVLSGWLTRGGAPQPFEDLFVEWVLSFDADPPPTASRVVRVDPEGTRWIRKTLRTNREGFFSADGLPDVQLRLQVGPVVLPVQAAENLRIPLDRSP